MLWRGVVVTQHGAASGLWHNDLDQRHEKLSPERSLAAEMTVEPHPAPFGRGCDILDRHAQSTALAELR
jgi:hypothetical protein